MTSGGSGRARSGRFELGRDRLLDPAAAEQAVAVVEDRGLAWRHAIFRLVEMKIPAACSGRRFTATWRNACVREGAVYCPALDGGDRQGTLPAVQSISSVAGTLCPVPACDLARNRS